MSDIPTHHLLRVTKLGPSFEFRALDSDNVKKYLQAHPNEVAYVAVPDPEHPEDADKTEFVLAANTDALQTFVRKHLDEADFFTDTTEFTRQDAK